MTNGASPPSPPRRGIWEWARAGTGRLNIIGRLPHPEWKSPGSASEAGAVVVNGAPLSGKTTAAHDDFSIPSATATQPDNVERQHTAAGAKIEGLGISPFPMPPTDFSQTAGSSDDLIANASETTGSPSPLLTKHGAWRNGEDTTPTNSKPSSPTTPQTPTPPQQRRSDSIMELPKTREISRASVSKSLQENIAALTPSTSHEARAEASGTQASAPPKANGGANSSQRRVPTYKIALAASMLSPGGKSRSASAAH